MAFLKWANAAMTIGLVLCLGWRSDPAATQQRSGTKANASRYKLLAHASADAIFDWDLTSQKLWWEPGMNNIFGVSEPNEPGPETWSGRIHPEDRERFDAGVRKIVEGSGNAWMDEFRLVSTPPGATVFVYARGHLFRDENGHAVRLLGGLHDITARRECEEQLKRSRQQLRALSAKLEALREEERKRIARELHDTLGQILTALKLNVVWSKKHLPAAFSKAVGKAVLDSLTEAAALADSAIETVQNIASELRPGLLDNLGLGAAIEHEVQRFRERTGIRCVVDIPDQLADLAPATTVNLFRIFQEAMTNVARHAQATEVRIRLWQDNDGVQMHMEICDNGKGISAEAVAAPTSLGLLGMQERAELLGGAFAIAPGESNGTTVSVKVPRHPKTKPSCQLK